MIKDYLKHAEERKALSIPPKPLNAAQVEALTGLLADPGKHDPDFLYDLIANRVPAGVDEAAEVKAGFLASVAKSLTDSPVITPYQAVYLLETMGGGFNIDPLIELLDYPGLSETAADALGTTILIFDSFDDIFDKSGNNKKADQVVQAWAGAKWFERCPALPESITVTAFRVDGEINTDDLSPASEAWSRPDIPLHATSMLKSRISNPLDTMARLKEKGHPLAFVGDVVGTGSSRKSAVNSLLWHIGEDIPHVPNKRRGGIVLGGKIAPIFFTSLQDAGALPVECDVSGINNGDVLVIRPYQGVVENKDTGQKVAEFTLKPSTITDEVRAGGRIPLLIGRRLTDRARMRLGLDPSEVFCRPVQPNETGRGYTLAQKMVGRACGKKGVRPGEYCEPEMTTVGSQDTTGPMTRDELKELACLKFSADLVMQSFCHTAAYPRSVDIEMQETLREFISRRGGVALYPGDGIIHSWLNRMLLPDTVGTGGDSHTRFPLGVSFPAGSGLVAFAAALGFMPLDMPESVRVNFSGKMQPGITVRDIVNAIAYTAIEKGLVTVEKSGKKNVFSGRIMEMQGLPELPVSEAYELTNAAAERSAAAAVISLDENQVARFLEQSAKELSSLIKEGYQDSAALQRRMEKMRRWAQDPQLLRPDSDAEYAADLEVDLGRITEPLAACPNDPDDVRILSEIAGTQVDEVFIGSCMTDNGHLRNAGRILEKAGRTCPRLRLWIAPPTRLAAMQLRREGWYYTFGRAGARMEAPGCSLCMGNQARVADNAVVFSTSTRNFPHRMGYNCHVYLGSAELAAVTAVLGKIPDADEYRQYCRPAAAPDQSM
ncbi:MAG: bifunctional aconitate hydratase 2/2-methylisocitrate dehydratase [Thermodesulfobacteriota bacterium]